MTVPSGRICVTFGFVKGVLAGQSVTAQVAADVSVLHLKNSLIQTHNACDPSTHSLKFVCEQTLHVLSDEETLGSLHLQSVDICVNVTRKTPLPAAATPATAFPFKNEQEFAVPAGCPEPLAPPPPPLTSIPCSATAALSNILRDGARVRIEGLRSKPELNGRCGCICGACDAPSGRWLVRVDPVAAGAASGDEQYVVSVKSENLQAASLQHAPPPSPSHTSLNTAINHPPPASRTKTPNVIATGPTASALLADISKMSESVADDAFVCGTNLSHDQQTKFLEAARALQQGSAAGEVDMSVYLSLYENIRKPEDQAIDSILPISTMVCLHRWSRYSLCLPLLHYSKAFFPLSSPLALFKSFAVYPTKLFSAALEWS